MTEPLAVADYDAVLPVVSAALLLVELDDKLETLADCVSELDFANPRLNLARDNIREGLEEGVSNVRASLDRVIAAISAPATERTTP